MLLKITYDSSGPNFRHLKCLMTEWNFEWIKIIQVPHTVSPEVKHGNILSSTKYNLMDLSRGKGWGSHQSVSFKHLEVREDPERKHFPVLGNTFQILCSWAKSITILSKCSFQSFFCCQKQCTFIYCNRPFSWHYGHKCYSPLCPLDCALFSPGILEILSLLNILLLHAALTSVLR